ncbi:hypothetical protein [Hymenobacter metallicola]|uniref:hypothetical protein n=1 Tax=Hymenobacter metallicola TaxID=2563114 RepID=UPI00107F4CE2|nr:hypothetical protein [Hymenobacter metallicola]
MPTVAQAQAPAWQQAWSISPMSQGATSVVRGTAVDASGNVFVTGAFSGTILLGPTLLTSAGNSSATDMFAAKWDAAAGRWAWATQGGGIGSDSGIGIALNGSAVYVTGYFASNSGAVFSGQALTGTTQSQDMFVARYTSSEAGFQPGWATSGGGLGSDVGYSVAVVGASVYVVGTTRGSATVAGQVLTGTASGTTTRVYLAKYIDTSTSTVASFSNGWASAPSGTGESFGFGLAAQGSRIYVSGGISGAVNFTGQALTSINGSSDLFLAAYTDTPTGALVNWATSGGGANSDHGGAVAVQGAAVYVTGLVSGPGTIAGQPLGSAGTNQHMFVARYTDDPAAATGFHNGWAASGTGNSQGLEIAVSGTKIYVAGVFASNAVMAGATLLNSGGQDVFLARYTDTSTGSASGFLNNWATSGGGRGADVGYSLALSGNRVYVGGTSEAPAVFGSQTLAGPTAPAAGFLASLTDNIATSTRSSAAQTTLRLFPNPGRAAVRLTGAAPHAQVQVLTLLGQLVYTTTADAAGTASLLLTEPLTEAIYMVRTGRQVVRLARQ